jgi:hypothetical protein
MAQEGPRGDEAERDEPLKTEPPVREPEVEQLGGGTKAEEQTTGESEAGGEPEVSTKVPKVHIELVPSGVMIETPLRFDDSPLPEHLRPSYIPPRANEEAWYRAGQLYTRKSMKHMGRRGTVDHVASSSKE